VKRTTISVPIQIESLFFSWNKKSADRING